MSEASGDPLGPDLPSDDPLSAVREALGRIQYGSILITIHQGEVTGIEISTRIRPKAHREGASSA
jgi:hypothetical protein